MGITESLAEMDEGWERATDVNAIVHCATCKSSFMGFGETTDHAASEAVASLADHRAKYHAVSKELHMSSCAWRRGHECNCHEGEVA